MISILKYLFFLHLSSIILIYTYSFAGFSGRITGKVSDATNRQPLQHISLKLSHSSENILTDEIGSYVISGLPPGDYPHNGKKEYIQMPGFTPWTFLEKRDIFLGLKIIFN